MIFHHKDTKKKEEKSNLKLQIYTDDSIAVIPAKAGIQKIL